MPKQQRLMVDPAGFSDAPFDAAAHAMAKQISAFLCSRAQPM